MTLYPRWVIATVGAAVAASLLTLPIYRHADALGLADNFTAWQAMGSLIESAVFVLVTYWALAPVFPKLDFTRYAAFTILPMLLLLALYAMRATDPAPADPPQSDELTGLILAAPILIGAAWGYFSLQWLALSEAVEGYRPWVMWSIVATGAMLVAWQLIALIAGPSLLSGLASPGRQLLLCAASVATSAVYGIVSGFGVMQLREKS